MRVRVEIVARVQIRDGSAPLSFPFDVEADNEHEGVAMFALAMQRIVEREVEAIRAAQVQRQETACLSESAAKKEGSNG